MKVRKEGLRQEWSRTCKINIDFFCIPETVLMKNDDPMKNIYKLFFIKILFLIFFGIAGFAQPKEKPNILIFIADDVSYNDFGCYGHPVIKTPNIDKLAKNGLRFTNAFLTISSCSPSRISILTGRYPHNTGAAELHTDIPAGQVLFPQMLKDAGYYTAQAGKWHLGSSGVAHKAFEKAGGAGAMEEAPAEQKNGLNI
jgi:N-sulfoglucosamine sulfohydrolase